MGKLTWYLVIRSCFICSNLRLSSFWRSPFFCARPTYTCLPFISLPFMSSTACSEKSPISEWKLLRNFKHSEEEFLLRQTFCLEKEGTFTAIWKPVPTFCASSCLSKLTKPNPLDLPLSSVMTRMLSAGPTEQQLINRAQCTQEQSELQCGVMMRNITIFSKQLLQLFIIHVFSKVLDVNIGEFPGTSPKLSLSLFAWLEAANEPVGKIRVRKKGMRPNIV